MEKRTFLKTISAVGAGLPLMGFNIPDWFDYLASNHDDRQLLSEDFWEKVRNDYELKPDYIHLESGYYNMIPKPTLDALIEHIRMVNLENSYYMRTVQWDNKDRMVTQLAEVVGCAEKNLIITRNTTESLDMVIKGFPWKKGDEAVFAIQDYGSMQDMFEQIAEQHGVILHKVSVPNHPKDDDEIVDLYAQAITPKTKLLMVCHMINITGHILPVKKICDMAHAKGVQVMVDGAHCVGHFDFKIEDLNCDYYGSSLHKWLAVPLGTGMLYVNNDNIDTLWPLFAEYPANAKGIRRLNHVGTIPVYHDLSIENAIKYYKMLGPQRKEDRLRYLQRYWTDQVRNYPGMVVNTPEAPHRSCAIANVGIEGIKPGEMAKRLLEEYKIWTVAIDGANVHGCRITPNVFTTLAELDQFVDALKDMAKN
jgi:selenocysteine lyase/cysteine desulfurase